MNFIFNHLMHICPGKVSTQKYSLEHTHDAVSFRKYHEGGQTTK